MKKYILYTLSGAMRLLLSLSGIIIKKILAIIPERWYILITMAQLPINIQIKNLRKKLGLTQIDFAKRAGVGLRFFRELEKGKTTVRLDKLNQVLDFLGVHLELMRDEK